MRILIFGDLHGESRWRKHVEKINHYDYVVFMGDYVDSFTHLDVEIIENLNNIMDFKNSFKDKVVLLLGNHDNQYIYRDFKETRCSGFRPHIYLMTKNRFRYNLDLFQVSFQIEDILFTHGGLLKSHYDELNLIYQKENDIKYDKYLNSFFKESPRPMLSVSPFRGGRDANSGIFWADWQELITENESLPINQIVGHTASRGGEFEIRKNNFIFNADSVLKNQTFHEIYRNPNRHWIIKNIPI